MSKLFQIVFFTSLVLFILNGCLTLNPSSFMGQFNINSTLNDLTGKKCCIAGTDDNELSIIGLKDYKSDAVIVIVSELKIDIFERWKGHGLVYIDATMSPDKEKINKYQDFASICGKKSLLPYQVFKDKDGIYTVINLQVLFKLCSLGTSYVKFALADGYNGICYTKGERQHVNYLLIKQLHFPVAYIESNDFIEMITEKEKFLGTRQ